MSQHLHVRVSGREAVFGTRLRELVVGSARGCAIRFTDDVVAPRHALLSFSDGGWTLETVDAERPVFRDGQPVGMATVDAPLVVRLGDPVSGPLLELAPAASELRDLTVDFESLPGAIKPAPQRPASRFALASELLKIGRDPESDLVVHDVLVSRRHAEIRSLGDGRYEVIDLSSHNGTFVNGRRISRVVLEELDVVGIGRYSYRLVDGWLEEFVDTGEVAYAAVDLTARLANGAVLLDRASFSLDSRSMLGVIGPSGSGKSTLLAALAGFRMADEGDVMYGERSLYANYDELRRRIGYVPQDDIVHSGLTVEHTLTYAADLRFPGDVDAPERRRRIQEVMEELALTSRRDTTIAALSGGERKRVSVGLELLTAPSLLFLDEPTTGLDPNYERSMMELCRELSNRGRTIVVATHSVQSLRLCDRVLVLASGGQVAYFGPPQLILAYFEKADFADVFDAVSERGDGDWGARFRAHPYHAAYVERGGQPLSAGPAERTSARASMRGRWRQFATLTRRYAATIAADRRNLALLFLQAPLLGSLTLVALPSGQLAPSPSSQLRLISQASLVLLVVVLAVTWLGMSNAVREIAKELPLYRRERAAGVSLAAYLGSKVCVLGAITVLQAVVLVAIALSAQHGPSQAVLLGWPLGEVIVIGALTGVAAMAIGLLISAAAKTTDRATSVLPIALVFPLVLALGGVFPGIADKPGLKQLGYLASTRWGFAGMASTGDLNNLQAVTGVLTRQPSVNVDNPDSLFHAFRNRYRGDPLWEHANSAWLSDARALIGLTLAALLAAGLALRRDQAG